MRLSLQVGRVPSICGKEAFRAHSSYRRQVSFEDAVNFSIDVERCLQQLEEREQQVIAIVVLKGYKQSEAANILQCTDRTIRSRLSDALDRLTEIFVKRGFLRDPSDFAGDDEDE